MSKYSEQCSHNPWAFPLEVRANSFHHNNGDRRSDGRWIVSGGAEGKVGFRAGQRAQREPQLLSGNESESGISAVAVSGDGRWVVAGGTDRMVRMWDRESPKPTLLTSWTNEAVVSSVAVSSDGRWVVEREQGMAKYGCGTARTRVLCH